MHSGFGILDIIVAAVDLSVAGITSAINYDKAKAAARKERQITAQTLQELERIKDEEIAMRKAAERQKLSLISKSDINAQRLTVFGFFSLISVVILGFSIFYWATPKKRKGGK